MPSWMTAAGLAVNLLGVVLVAFAQARLAALFEAWLSTNSMTTEMMARGGDVAVFRGWDRQIERAKILTKPLLLVGWGFIILGVAMQLVAAIWR